MEILFLTLIHSILSFFNFLNVKSEIYALGTTSSLIGRKLIQQQQKQNFSNSNTTISFIMIDRVIIYFFLKKNFLINLIDLRSCISNYAFR